MRTRTPTDLADELGTNLYRPTGAPDIELEWFFTMADSAMGCRSNYAALLLGDVRDDSPEACAEAARARRKILGHLTYIGDPKAGVLSAAYEPKPWPLALREALGRLTGVVVRLDSAAGGRLPDDTFGRAAFDLRSAARLTAILAGGERALLVPLVSCARSLLRDAVVAYERARGGHERPVVRGIR
jgi:hypothetical protein